MAASAAGPAQSEYKSWHFSDAYRTSPAKPDGYELFPPGPSDKRTVIDIYNQTPIPGLEIKRITVVHNPALNKQFASRLTLLNARHGNPAFEARYEQESHSETRRKIVAWQKDQSAHHQDLDVPHVQIQPVWHGMPVGVFASVCKTGYANLATTDHGFFGKGLYNSFEPKYAYECYATQHGLQEGALILNWVATYSSYPVVDGDMGKLRGKGNYQNYDAHLIPVKPRDPFNPKEMTFLPCKPGEIPTYHEIVVFEQASCLPRYRVDVGPPSGPLPGLSCMTLPGEEDFIRGRRLYRLGLHKEALPFLEKAAAARNPFSYALLLLMHQNKSVEISEADQKRYRRELSNQIVEIKRLADEGEAEAQNSLGLCYEMGTSAPKKRISSGEFYWLGRQRDAVSQFELGCIYADGNGVLQNLTKAAKHFKLAADQGHAPAQCNLGWCYENGKGVPKDLSEAARYFKLAADQGFAEEQSNLVGCYKRGDGITKDLTEAARYYKLAADQGHADAQFNLGWCYENGKGVPIDPTKAARYFKLASDRGHAAAQYTLGWCHESGKGVPKDPTETARYYKLAADQGHAAAQYELGRCYYKGRGVPEDLSEAAKYYKLAADRGHGNGQLGVGNCYENGLGVTKDLTEAARYFKLAADQGYAYGQASLERLKLS